MSAGRRRLLTNHNRCWIWGRNAVLETLRAGYWPMQEFLHSDRCEEDVRQEAVQLAMKLGVTTHSVSDEQIEKNCRSDEHQGLAGRMPPFPYRTLDELAERWPTKPVLVMLDRVHDSYNFGAIIRSANVLGIDAVIVGTREQALVNSHVARSSAGAVNYVPIAQTHDLAMTVQSLREQGFQIIGTSDRAATSIFETNLNQSTVLLIGNEGRGISTELESLCSCSVKIPVLGQVSSLNAAVSAGILFYEVLRQRRG